MPKIAKARMSFSGSERNSLFLKSKQGQFANASGISGFDSKSDGRCLATMDFDNNGLVDLLVTNANKPTLAIYANRIYNQEPDNKFIAIKVFGGNKTSSRSDKFSNRDGIGALIRVATESQTQIREVRCGEGLATQNSRLNIFGIGKSELVKWLEIKWPSGIKSRIENLEAGSLVEVFENPNELEKEENPDYRITQYDSRQNIVDVVKKQDDDGRNVDRLPIEIAPSQIKGQLTVIVGMATWCENCVKEISNVNAIQQTLGDKIRFIAIPIDKNDTQEKIDEFVEKHNPVYDVARSPLNAIKLTEFVADRLGEAKTPFSVVVSEEADILLIRSGIPTLSELRKTSTDSP